MITIKGIIFTTKEHYQAGLDYLNIDLVKSYSKVGIQPYIQKERLIEFKNQDIWEVYTEDQASDKICNVCYIDTDIIEQDSLFSCLSNAPYAAYCYLSFE